MLSALIEKKCKQSTLYPFRYIGTLLITLRLAVCITQRFLPKKSIEIRWVGLDAITCEDIVTGAARATNFQIQQ